MGGVYNQILSKPIVCSCIYTTGIRLELTTEDMTLNHNTTFLSEEVCTTQQKHVSPVVKEESLGHVTFAEEDSAQEKTAEGVSPQSS